MNKLLAIVASFGLALGLQAAELPDDLTWETNQDDPIFASPEAKRGGQFNMTLLSFPLTFRTVGPDSNTSFRSFILENQLGLYALHPQTENPIPALATHWAFGDDDRTMYFKLNPAARWSDGEPVTADDYLFALEFMRSKVIRAPWYNNYFTEELTDVTKYDDYTISVTAGSPKSRRELLNTVGLVPQPEHFYELSEDWVRRYNWEVAPVTGAYVISDVKRGRSITFKRLNDWWGNDLTYYRHRFNVDEIRLTVVRDLNIAYRHFLRGDVDTFGLILPEWWHDKTNTPEYRNGLINRIWFYNDMQQGAQGLHLNTAHPRLSDVRVRKGIAHAINMQRMLETILRGDYERMNSFGTGYGDFTDYDIRAREYNIQQARALFAEAGFDRQGPGGILLNAKGDRLSLAVTYTTQEHTARLAILREEARKAGLDLQLNLVDGATGFKSMLEKKHEAAWLGWSGGGLYPQYWEFFHSLNAGKPQTNNLFNISDDELDRLIEEYRRTMDLDAKAAISRQIQRRVHELAIFIPGYQVPYTREAYWRYVKLPESKGTRHSPSLFWPMEGYPHSTGGLFWIDQQQKAEIKAGGKRFEPVLEVVETWRRPEA
ncbi:extracellular solute-binding protein [Oceanimonas sp. CHS3-5]|uniref:extracellular solute-binding protein n=1 Tax=Oceanimonas sp. CHS3-5 TaxID=3068186 RepID=UPI00273FD8D4|nr:extracellular solute-binding protein [Oceanimonas sp. CHS3-5]MDP5293727.1 extracellular solute-binding protein [Oceanimonas sp. CHS3-5]